VLDPVQQDDAELVRRSIAGDEPAFAAMVQRYRSFVVTLAYRLCGDPAWAEDIAQDVFVRVWQALPGFRGDAAFRSWLYRIASNKAIEHLRRARPAGPIEDIPLTDGSTPEDEVLRSDQHEAVRRAVLRLPPQSRLALVLREYQGLSYKEIAAVLSVPIGTVMSRLHYARQRLARDLAWYILDSRSEES